MRPVTETPTEPQHYAAISLTYGALLGAVAHASRKRDPIPSADLVPLAAATFTVSKLVAKEKAETWVRAPFVDEGSEDRVPKGQGLRYAIGELLTCTRCLGAWSALGLVGLRVFAPKTSRTVTSVLAASAGNDFLQSGFSYLCARTNIAEEIADDPRGPGQAPEEMAPGGNGVKRAEAPAGPPAR
jgi:hypothetical protein